MTDKKEAFKMSHREMTVFQKDGKMAQAIVPRNAFVTALNPSTRARVGGLFVINHVGEEVFIPEGNISNTVIRPMSDEIMEQLFPEEKNEDKKQKEQGDDAPKLAEESNTSKSKTPKE